MLVRRATGGSPSGGNRWRGTQPHRVVQRPWMSRASRVHTIHARWTRNIVALAVAEGADEDALWSAAGLVPDALGDEVPEERHLRVWEAIMRALESPGFPIRVASRRSIDEYALLGLACKTSDAVRDALGHLIRFTGVWRSQYRCELVERASSADLVLEGPSGSLGRRCTNESAVAQILKALRDVSRTPVDPIRVSFRHAAPADVREHERFFGCKVEFDAPFDGLTLSTSTLDSKLLLADDALSTFLVGQLEQLARKLVSTEPLTDKVRGRHQSFAAGRRSESRGGSSGARDEPAHPAASAVDGQNELRPTGRRDAPPLGHRAPRPRRPLGRRDILHAGVLRTQRLPPGIQALDRNHADAVPRRLTASRVNPLA